MSLETAWSPYSEQLLEELNHLSPAPLLQLGGFDLLPEASCAHENASGQLCLLQSTNLSRIALATVKSTDLHIGLCLAFPRADYDLPIFFSRWQETMQDLSYYVDLLPTVDFLVDEAYRIKYFDPLDQDWQRFANLAGIWPEDDDLLRSVSSIVYTAAHSMVGREGQRLAALAVHSTYLKHYIAFVHAAVPIAKNDKRAEIKRKTIAIGIILKDYLERYFAGPAGQLIGSANTERLLAVCS